MNRIIVSKYNDVVPHTITNQIRFYDKIQEHRNVKTAVLKHVEIRDDTWRNRKGGFKENFGSGIDSRTKIELFYT